MKAKEWIRRETYVAIHGQTSTFRIIKYIILTVIAATLWYWNGWMLVLQVFAGLFVLALVVHFVFRWKTKAWTQSWGPYKKLKLPC